MQNVEDDQFQKIEKIDTRYQKYLDKISNSQQLEKMKNKSKFLQYYFVGYALFLLANLFFGQNTPEQLVSKLTIFLFSSFIIFLIKG